MKLNKILVIGGGIAGMCAAIELRKRGTQVDLVELDPHWRVYGAGITLSGPTLRAFTESRCDRRHHGARLVRRRRRHLHRRWPQDRRTAHAARRPARRAGRWRHPAADARPHPAAPHAGLGYRGALRHDVQRIEPDGDGVRVSFTDGREERYDLVVGADGLQSEAARQTVFPDAPKPRYTGQGSWRAVVPRPPEIHARPSSWGRTSRPA